MFFKFLQSFFLGIFFTAWEILEYLFCVGKYYHRLKFGVTDLYLLIRYPLTSSYHICFAFLKDHPEERVQVWYGETALSTFEKITTAAKITEKDHLFELGSGRGRLVFWASTFLGCKTTGIDINPTFIKRAKKIQQWLKWEKVDFLEANFLDVPLSQASVIYLYGTAFEAPAWPLIIEELSKTKSGTKVITVSRSLAQCGDTQFFKCNQTLWVRYVWGKGPVYIQERV